MASPLPSYGSGHETLSAINVTPLVDVMLVLLIIFMITAKLGDQPALPLDLPRAASGDAVQRMLNITLDAQGKRALDGVPVPDDGDLRAKLRAAHVREPDVRCVIQGSRRASHGDVMRALDAARLAGISKVAFAVEPAP